MTCVWHLRHTVDDGGTTPRCGKASLWGARSPCLGALFLRPLDEAMAATDLVGCAVYGPWSSFRPGVSKLWSKLAMFFFELR